MEYERIHKLQSSMVSPTKLRMKLTGPHMKMEVSNSNSSTFPSALEQSELFNNHDFGLEEASSSSEPPPVNSGSATSDSGQSGEVAAAARGLRMQLVSANSSSIHPVRTSDDDNLDYDSTSSFEFHKGERSGHNAGPRSLSRPVSSKWNDAEKWIMNKQYLHPSILKRSDSQNQAKGPSAIRSVSMRDMGTEMTPIPSLDPSRSVTPVDSTTPLRSPTSSIPSTPRRAGPDPTPTEKKELSEQEMKLKTRREIVALGVQLGKMNIAAWASKDERESGEEIERIENVKRAAAWEEAEKSKHFARYKREEVRIQAWEGQQKAQLEAEMRKIEALIEQMRAHAQAKMVKKVALARQKSEEKRAEAEARRSRRAGKSAAQAGYIRRTGRIPSGFQCCGW